MARAKKNDHNYNDNARGDRLQKVMANAGIAARRECEAIIEAGRVTINGERISVLPAWVNAYEDRVEVDGEPLTKPRRADNKFASAGKIYVMVHKPRGMISTNDDPEGRARVIDLIDPGTFPRNVRLYPVGRLDADSTGLILLTNDGDLTHRLTHPSFGVTKRYLVMVKGRIEESDLSKLRSGLTLATSRADAGPTKAKKAAVESVVIIRHETDRQRGDRTTLGITLSEGQNREIRRLLAKVGLKVRKLKRTSIGPLKLKGLALRQWRVLTRVEIGQLRKAAGKTPAS
ncbi:MAG: pseudouridine synthase [Algisphaera sp.]